LKKKARQLIKETKTTTMVAVGAGGGGPE